MTWGQRLKELIQLKTPNLAVVEHQKSMWTIRIKDAWNTTVCEVLPLKESFRPAAFSRGRFRFVRGSYHQPGTPEQVIEIVMAWLNESKKPRPDSPAHEFREVDGDDPGGFFVGLRRRLFEVAPQLELIKHSEQHWEIVHAKYREVWGAVYPISGAFIATSHDGKRTYWKKGSGARHATTEDVITEILSVMADKYINRAEPAKTKAVIAHRKKKREEKAVKREIQKATRRARSQLRKAGFNCPDAK